MDAALIAAVLHNPTHPLSSLAEEVPLSGVPEWSLAGNAGYTTSATHHEVTGTLPWCFSCGRVLTCSTSREPRAVGSQQTAQALLRTDERGDL